MMVLDQCIPSTADEATARRAAGSAERAYDGLAKELAEPRATIDLVVADNVDASNGYTTPFPTPRVVIYARPTVDVGTLKFLDDWIDLVVTHELAHVFHMDRVRGLFERRKKDSHKSGTHTPEHVHEGALGD